MADVAIVCCTILYLVWALLPWVSIGAGFYIYGSISGFGWSGLVVFGFVLFLLASAWAALPAVPDLAVGVPRSWGIVGLGAVGTVATFLAWVSSLAYGLGVFALLGLLTAVALTGVAVVRLLPELPAGLAPTGRLAGAARWANRELPAVPGRFRSDGR